jgi:hypothetical protein
MNKLKFGIIGCIAVAGAAAALVVQHHYQFETDESLRLHQLGAENERLSSLAAQASKPLSPEQVCRSNLAQIDNAIAQYALENRIGQEAFVTSERILPYLKSNKVPRCPSGGTYSILRVGDPPTCSIQGHSR